MGKAKRKINAARKEIFKEISSQYSQKPDNEYEKTCKVVEDPDTILRDLAYHIRESLFEYVNETAHPLCEYLDIDNMINYIEWIVEPHL